MSTSGMRTGRVAALVAGAIVMGAGMGLLLSPQPGAETRKQLREYARKKQIEAAKVGRSVRGQVDKAIEYGKTMWPKKLASSRAAA